MVGYWSSSFFGVFMDWDTVEVHEDASKVTLRISSHIDGKTIIVNNGFIIWKEHYVLVGCSS